MVNPTRTALRQKGWFITQSRQTTWDYVSQYQIRLDFDNLHLKICGLAFRWNDDGASDDSQKDETERKRSKNIDAVSLPEILTCSRPGY